MELWPADFYGEIQLALGRCSRQLASAVPFPLSPFPFEQNALTLSRTDPQEPPDNRQLTTDNYSPKYRTKSGKGLR